MDHDAMHDGRSYADVVWSLWREAAMYIFVALMIQLGLLHSGGGGGDENAAAIMLSVLCAMYALQVVFQAVLSCTERQ